MRMETYCRGDRCVLFQSSSGLFLEFFLSSFLLHSFHSICQLYVITIQIHSFRSSHTQKNIALITFHIFLLQAEIFADKQASWLCQKWYNMNRVTTIRKLKRLRKFIDLLLLKFSLLGSFLFESSKVLK